MNAAILIVAVIFVMATNAAPIRTECVDSTALYDYCNRTTKTLQGGDSLNSLYVASDDVIDTFTYIYNKYKSETVSKPSMKI